MKSMEMWYEIHHDLNLLNMPFETFQDDVSKLPRKIHFLNLQVTLQELSQFFTQSSLSFSS